MSYHLSPTIDIYFGSVGSGKSTFAAYLASRSLKHNIPVYSNFAISGCCVLDPKNDLGKYNTSNSHIIVDECGLDFDNRQFKTNFKDKDLLYFFKYHRHYNCHIDFFSQGLDIDLKLRTLASNLYLVKRSIIPFFCYRKKISRKVSINELSKELIDEYYFVPFSKKYIFMPLYWKKFDSYECKELPEKEWLKWLNA